MPYYATGSELPYLRAFDNQIDRDRFVDGYCSNAALSEQEAFAMLDGVDKELATPAGLAGLGCYIEDGTGFALIRASRLLQTFAQLPGICSPPVLIDRVTEKKEG